jgi:hypothetical protein
VTGAEWPASSGAVCCNCRSTYHAEAAPAVTTPSLKPCDSRHICLTGPSSMMGSCGGCTLLLLVLLLLHSAQQGSPPQPPPTAPAAAPAPAAVHHWRAACTGVTAASTPVDTPPPLFAAAVPLPTPALLLLQVNLSRQPLLVPTARASAPCDHCSAVADSPGGRVVTLTQPQRRPSPASHHIKQQKAANIWSVCRDTETKDMAVAATC